MFRAEIYFYNLNLFIYMIYVYMYDLKLFRDQTYYSYKKFRSENLDLTSEISVYA